ncbi:MAG TPA: hypothetical protein VMC85_02535 [Desulfomonilaceae bacterium]|nr:hypothetical protein [Desulfomonilaceae bacterium]
MDDVQKCKIRLKHWIDHNLEHMKGYEDAAHLLQENGYSEAAEMIRHGTHSVEVANAEFEKALASLGGENKIGDGPADASGSVGHHHEHSHDSGD